MTSSTNLQQIISLSSLISTDYYADQVRALRQTIPSQLKTLITISEHTALNSEMRNLVEENVISSYKELLAEVTYFNSRPDQSRAKDLINWFRCEIEMGMLFLEGIYRYCDQKENLN